MLSPTHLQQVCLISANDPSKTCRYLKQDDSDSSKFYCKKLVVNDKDKIDDKVQAFLRMCRAAKIDPQTQGVPMGDNCKGYPLLKYKIQGYDVDGK
jgi:hypothetical protein